MKTCIKSLLAITTVALLGSSAWANANITLHVGERFPLMDADNYSFSHSGGDRWYKLATAEDKGTNEFVQGVFEDAHATASFLSNGAQGTTKFYFVGTKPTNEPQVLKLFRCSVVGDTVPNIYNKYPYGDTKTWKACEDQTYTITVKEPEYKLVENPVEVTATRITFAAGEQTGEQYVGYVTKAGNQYACGKDDEPTEAFRKSDGSPHEKLAGTTQLFVIEAK